MPRPPRHALVEAHEVDTSALTTPGMDDLMTLLEQLIRAANSDQFRRSLMAAASFPSTDLQTFLAMNQLALHGALRPTDLAERLETGRPNVTKIVQRLEQSGLAIRAADPEDDRGVLVALTTAGREVAGAALAHERRFLDSAVAAWEPSEVEELKAILRRFLDDVGQTTFV